MKAYCIFMYFRTILDLFYAKKQLGKTPNLPQMRRFGNVLKKAIFGYFAKAIVRQNFQKWPIFTLNFKMPKIKGKQVL